MTFSLMRLTQTARIPTRATEWSAGLDLYADETTTIPEYCRVWVKTGIAVALDPYHVGQVWPRSGLAGHGLDTSAGIVDSDYRGEIKVLLCNGTPHRKTVHSGDRIAQLLLVPIARPNMIEVDALPASVRGEDGFGSSGQ